jgi:hypothetical protein
MKKNSDKEAERTSYRKTFFFVVEECCIVFEVKFTISDNKMGLGENFTRLMF